MAVETGYQTQYNITFPLGVTDKFEREVEAVIKSGRLAIRGTTDWDIIPADCLKPPIGIVDYERVAMDYKPATMATDYAVGAVAPVCNAPGKPVFTPTGLAAGFVAEEGDLLIPWGVAGQMAPAIKIGGGYGVKIPFIKKTSEFDTGIDLPAGILVKGWAVKVSTEASGASIDAGILSTEVGGDTDGFIDGASLAATGMVFSGNVDGTAGNNTTGVLLVESDITSADTSALILSVQTPYKTDGTAKSVVYQTSNHTVAGYFYLVIDSPGIVEVGKAKVTTDASTAAKDLTWMSLI